MTTASMRLTAATPVPREIKAFIEAIGGMPSKIKSDIPEAGLFQYREMKGHALVWNEDEFDAIRAALFRFKNLTVALSTENNQLVFTFRVN